MPDGTHMDLIERVAALEQMLVARTAERDPLYTPFPSMGEDPLLPSPSMGEGWGGGDAKD